MENIIRILLPYKTRKKQGDKKTFDTAVKKLRDRYNYALSLSIPDKKETVVIELYIAKESEYDLQI